MIDLTPIEIRKKKGDFPRSIRGYEPAEVDLFLDLVADRLEAAVSEVMRLEERLRHVEASLGAYTEREKSLTEALVSAQELREDSRRQASREAELIRREAEVEANRILADAIRAREQEATALKRLQARRAQLLLTFRSFLERELSEISAMVETLGVSPQASSQASSQALPGPAVGAPYERAPEEVQAAPSSGPTEATPEGEG